MQITIAGHQFEVTPALNEYVTQKMTKVEKRFKQITDCHIVMSVGKKYQQKIEATLNLSHHQIHASSENENMYAAIDDLVDKLDRQVVKHKEIISDHGDSSII